MPTGVLLVAERAITLAGGIRPAPKTVLDVGPGFGKYGVLLREYLDPTPGQIDAVEAWTPYIDAHGLRGIYGDVFPVDATRMGKEHLDEYDLVMMGDVIEHMEKGDALAFLSNCRGWVVIATPLVHFDTGPGLPPTEAHVSHWERHDLEATGRLDHYEEAYGSIVARLRPL